MYAAVHVETGRQVALKVLNATLFLTSKLRRRFEREAWVAGKLDHSNIVKVYEHGTWEGIDYIAMERIEDGSMQDVVEQMHRKGRDSTTGLEFRSAAYVQWVVRQCALAARALDHAHGKGVVHRDVKPGNLLLGGSPPEVRVADFGIALDEDATRFTTDGRILGTLRYMAPEQLRPGQEIDGRADVYALGVTMFALLTLEHPHPAATYEQYLHAVLNDVPRRAGRLNDRIGRDLETVIETAIATEPRDRYRTAGDLADDLECVLHSRPIRARAVGWSGRTVRWARRKPIHAALAAALALGIPAVSGVGYVAVRQSAIVRQEMIDHLVENLNALATSGRDAEIAGVADELLRLDPDHPIGLRNRATAAFNLSLFETDTAKEERLLATAFESVDRWIEVQPERAGPRMLEAHFLRKTGRPDEAERVEREIPPNAPADEDSLYFQGILAFEKGDLVRAEELFSEVLLLRNRKNALRGRAAVLIRLERLDEAERDLRSLGGLDPDDANSPAGLAQIERLRGNYEEAERLLQRALTLGGQDVWVHVGLSENALEWAQQLRLDGRSEEALEKLAQAERYARAGLEFDVDGKSAWLPINLGLSLVEQHRWSDQPDTSLLEEAAGNYARAASAGGRTRPFAIANQCDLLIELRDLDRAFGVCNDYIALAPSDPDGYYNLAAVHTLAGRIDEALAALERDLALGDTEWRYLQQDPWFASLRNQPEFEDLLRRMKKKAESPDS